jgi:membrane-associated phospholipid phosphatase
MKGAGRFLAGLLLATVMAPPWARGADDPQETPSDSRPLRDDGRRTLRALPRNLGRGFLGVFHQDNLTPLLIGSTVTAGATYLDDEAKEAIGPHDWGETFASGAGPVWSSAFVLSMFTAGRIADGQRFRAMTYDMLDAVVVNVVYTEIVKQTVGRERPNGENDLSFPSGHTSNSFALAAVAERHYGWKVGVPAYALAAVVGASRIQQDKHYLSDVVGGATLGYIVGRTVVRVNSRPPGASGSARIDVAPILGRGARGARLSVVF